MVFQEAQNAALLWAEFFCVRSIKTKAQANHNLTQAMTSFFPEQGNFADKS